jgi:hypothetical protein
MNKKAFCQPGSLYLSVTLLLIFLTVFMGIVLNQALLFSGLVHKKQEYTAHFYAADALAEYGVAYALENYKETELVFDPWPEHEPQSPYSGTISITKKEDGRLGVQATLLVGSVTVQRVSCELQKMLAQEPGRQLYQVVNWSKA